MKNAFKNYCVLLIIFSLFIGCENNDSVEITSTSTEDNIRNQLGIPSSAKRVLILSHAAHMDWDWLNPFQYNVDETGPVFNSNYFNGTTSKPANGILTKATANLKDPDYYYSVCEMGFLRAFAQDNPSLFNTMKASQRLRIVGGGITSPDNLLPNGEAFLRNFLVANQWLDSVQIPWSHQVWMPDDFGHNPQLPVMLNAMDAMGVGFARIPGACDGNPQVFQTPKLELLDNKDGGVDFIWQADDGSQTIAHWLQAHYSQGSDIDGSNSDFATPGDIATCGSKINSSNPVDHITSYLGANGPVSPTPYIYVHVSNDFMVPYQELVADANKWNNDVVKGYPKTGVYAVVATFDEYIRLVNQNRSSLKTRKYNAPSASANQPFSPNPYWMGYYASRPELKILHNKGTRKLLGAETFQVMANKLLNTSDTEKQKQSAAIYKAWDGIASSTHHDFITGTAVDDVYQKEQLPILSSAVSAAENISNLLLNDITNNLPVAPDQIAVFNQLGMDNKGIIPYTTSTGIPTYINVTAPSMGYHVQSVTQALKGDGTLLSTYDNENYIFKNSMLTMLVDKKTGDLKAVYDTKTNQNILSGVGNDIEFYQDGGDIYRFGFEGHRFFQKDTTVTSKVDSIIFNTKNSLQISITVKKTYTIKQSYENPVNIEFTTQYSLRQGEPFVRISTTGKAPANYSVLTRFPLSAPIVSLDVGTPYHWNNVIPVDYGNQAPFSPTMWATHDFVIPKNSTTAMAAIYHSATPTWTSVGNNLYGVILRNNPSGGACGFNYGAQGSDSEQHTQTYALRIPSGLSDPASGKPLKEARQYNTPMQAFALPSSGGGNGSLPRSYSIAEVTQGDALISAAKWGAVDPTELVLRLSQSSNGSQTQLIKLAEQITSCGVVSSLEKPIVNNKIIPNCTSNGQRELKLEMPKAVATISINH